MADISKINTNSTEYNIKDTMARNGLTDRPTSFVGTRPGWNALPVATQVKYSLVCLKGEGIYKNNGTGLELIADVGMPESYPANNVMMSDGVTSVEDAVPKVTDWYTIPNDITVTSSGWALVAHLTDFGLTANDANRVINVQLGNLSSNQKPFTFEVSDNNLNGVFGGTGTIFKNQKIRLIYI